VQVKEVGVSEEGGARVRQGDSGGPADAGLPGLHGWAFWGAGTHPRRYVYLIFSTCPTKITFGFFTALEFSFHKPFQPPITW
jgi:hypothetical protein